MQGLKRLVASSAEHVHDDDTQEAVEAELPCLGLPGLRRDRAWLATGDLAAGQQQLEG